jgi:hypothetical protein
MQPEIILNPEPVTVDDDAQGQVPWNGIVIANPLEELWDALPPIHDHQEVRVP